MSEESMEAKAIPDSPDDISTFYIQATESIQQRWPRTLKQGDTFAMFDALGDCIEPGLTPGGVFYNDTRYLSGMQLLLDGQRPLLLSSAMEQDNVVLTVDLTNPDIYQGNAIVLPRESLHIRRSKFLWEGACHERIAIHNFDARPQKFWLTVNFAADFADLFEIRGMVRPKRGDITTAVIGGAKTIFRYMGLDKVERRTEVGFDPAPKQLNRSQALYELDLPPGEGVAIVITVRCTSSAEKRADITQGFAEPYRAARRGAARAANLGGSVTSSNELANKMLHRAGADLSMLVTDTPQGPYPYAGTPWFSTPFGRDGIITALEMLWLDPELARGVLRYLAAHQATTLDDRADAEPGKILHETRACEMAVLGEVPFGHYYGSIDSTPLFVMLAARYFQRTGDSETMRELWPNIDAALNWIDQYGDRDGDGFVEYYRVSENGLTNQGWKDSSDSIMHADGSLATGPIALCEVQGYVYAAKKEGAVLATAHGLSDPCPCAGRGGGEAARRLRGKILARGTGHLCHCAGRRQGAVPGAFVQCRAGAGLRHRQPRTRPDRGQGPDDAGAVLRLGHPHAERRRAALQSHELSQWLGVAARQCHHRAGPGALWPEARRRRHLRRPVRCRCPHGNDALP
jgi:glycogen debranching enzyme